MVNDGATGFHLKPGRGAVVRNSIFFRNRRYIPAIFTLNKSAVINRVNLNKKAAPDLEILPNGLDYSQE